MFFKFICLSKQFKGKCSVLYLQIFLNKYLFLLLFHCYLCVDFLLKNNGNFYLKMMLFLLFIMVDKMIKSLLFYLCSVFLLFYV